MRGMDHVELPGAGTPVEGAHGPQGQAQTPEQLRLLAAQFEAMLLSQMLSSMRSSMFGDDEDAGFAKGPLADAMYTELSLALSRAGGFGMADAMLDPIMRQTGIDIGGAGEGTFALPGMPQPAGLAAFPSGLPQAIPATGAPVSSGAAPALREALFEGRLSSNFGWREHPVTGGLKFHQGVDIAMPEGRDVPAARAGEVTFAGEQGGYGLTVVIDHGGGVSTRYAHLSELKVQQGDRVTDGQTIALSGATGRVTGAHLHFEVLDQGRPIDPAAGVGRLYASR